jgi:NADH-ubiquinone oxidoreductase chain 5
LVLGSLTILIAGISAIGEVDIKKIIALSTLRQLGLIFFVLGIGLPTLSFFHLIIHAYFKAILFICAGGVIHRIKEFQDLRAIGGGAKQIPISISIFLVANLSLCGVPFIRGFFSKDLILELIIISGSRITTLILAILATGITVAYSCRIIKLVFLNTPL